jgi:hypothetical protein
MKLRSFLVTIHATWLPTNTSMKNVVMPVLYMDIAKCASKVLNGGDHTFGAN